FLRALALSVPLLLATLILLAAVGRLPGEIWSRERSKAKPVFGLFFAAYAGVFALGATVWLLLSLSSYGLTGTAWRLSYSLIAFSLLVAAMVLPVPWWLFGVPRLLGRVRERVSRQLAVAAFCFVVQLLGLLFLARDLIRLFW